MVPGSRLLDTPADGLSVEESLVIAQGYGLVILHTSTPSFPTDAKFAELLKARNPNVVIGMVGAKVAVDATGSLKASHAIDWVAREEFDYTCREVAEGKPFSEIPGISYRRQEGVVTHTVPRPMIENMDELPFVAPVYQRHLKIEN